MAYEAVGELTVAVRLGAALPLGRRAGAEALQTMNCVAEVAVPAFAVEPAVKVADWGAIIRKPLLRTTRWSGQVNQRRHPAARA